MAINDMFREDKECQMLAGDNLGQSIGTPDTVIQSEASTRSPIAAVVGGPEVRGDRRYHPIARGQTASPLSAHHARLASPERILVVVPRVSRIFESYETA